MEAAADISSEYLPAEQVRAICQIAIRDESLIGETVLIRHLPPELAVICPDANRMIEDLFEHFGHPEPTCEGLGLEVVGFDASSATTGYTKVYLNDCLGHGTIPVAWNILFLAVFGNQAD